MPELGRQSLGVLAPMTTVANGNQPVDWLPSDIAPSVSLVVNLCGAGAARYAPVAVALQDKSSLALPFVRLEIRATVVFGPLLAAFVPQPMF